MYKQLKSRILAAGLFFFATAVTAAELQVIHYNPAQEAVFPVSSSLIMGEQEAILVDAQFSLADGEALVKMINASGKALTSIYISGGDPDFYFGLQPIVAAFPDARVIASSAVVAHIEKTKQAKLAYWGPILAEQAPQQIIVPAVFDETTLLLEGETIEVKEINTHQAYLWLPATKTALGGVLVSNGIHLWMADSQTVSARAEWVKALERLLALQPKQVIPGHYLGALPDGAAAVQFSLDYLLRFEQLLSQKPDAAKLIKDLQQAYPHLPVDDSLSISAKVSTGEMTW